MARRLLFRIGRSFRSDLPQWPVGTRNNSLSSTPDTAGSVSPIDAVLVDGGICWARNQAIITLRTFSKETGMNCVLPFHRRSAIVMSACPPSDPLGTEHVVPTVAASDDQTSPLVPLVQEAGLFSAASVPLHVNEFAVHVRPLVVAAFSPGRAAWAGEVRARRRDRHPA